MADKYSNMLYETVTESAANTLTFKAIEMGISLFDKAAILIQRLMWYNFQTLLAATTDAIQFGLSASNSWSAPSASQGSIIHFHEQSLLDYGTAGNNILHKQPVVDDFTTLPGGGMLIAPKPLYLFAKGSNLSNPSSPQMRMFFTIVKLSDADYFELLESRHYFG